MGRVIAERHVRLAAKDGRLEVSDHAILTPAARELAHKLGVALVKGETATGSVTDPARGGAVAVGCDHGGFALKQTLKPLLGELGWTVEDVGCHGTDPVDYPVFAARVAEQVAGGHARFGIIVDGAGIGSAMVANKIPGVRAALCYDLSTARNAREHNDANVLTLGGTLIGARRAGEIVRAFLTTTFAGGRHQRRVAMIEALDGERSG